jgi:hypothetical protein
MKLKSKTITFRVSQETADRCEQMRLAGVYKYQMNSTFSRAIFQIGLAHYEKAILPFERERTAGENITAFPDRLAVGCEAAPETIWRTETKIIPFPGVSISHEVTYQNALDDFLREMGYTD